MDPAIQDNTAGKRIYVASLADYNSGKLHGVWIDCDNVTEEAIQEAIDAMLASSREPIAEEWAIHDHEGFGNLLGEFSTIDEVVKHANMLDEHGPAWAAFVDNFGDSADADDFREAFRGEWPSVEEYAEQFLDDLGTFQNVGDLCKNYFDYAAFARDLVYGGDIWTADGPNGVFIFENC